MKSDNKFPYLTSNLLSIRLGLNGVIPAKVREHSVLFVTGSEGESCISLIFSDGYVSEEINLRLSFFSLILFSVVGDDREVLPSSSKLSEIETVSGIGDG